MELKDYRLKEIELHNTRIKKVVDNILKSHKYYSYKNEESGFTASVFENIKNKNIVIAYRGTERINFGENNNDLIAWYKDITTDINFITGNLDQQFDDAYELYKIIKSQNPKSKIILIGHSLGGGLCQMVAAREYSETYHSKNPVKINTYTYNAPGCKHMMDKYKCLKTINYDFITNYAVMNDWCGMYGEKIGVVYLIEPILLEEVSNNLPLNVLNNVLLTTHEGIFNYTKEKNGKIIKKPDDFNQQEGLSLWYYDKNNPIKNIDKISDFVNSAMPKFSLPITEYMNHSIRRAARKFIEEQREKMIQIETPHLKSLKSAANKILLKNFNYKEKFIESINNNIITSLTKLLETTIKDVSLDSYKKARRITRRIIRKYKSKR